MTAPLAACLLFDLLYGGELCKQPTNHHHRQFGSKVHGHFTSNRSVMGSRGELGTLHSSALPSVLPHVWATSAFLAALRLLCFPPFNGVYSASACLAACVFHQFMGDIHSNQPITYTVRHLYITQCSNSHIF